MRHLNSHISVRAFQATSDDGIRHDDSRKPRSTEIEALQRIAFGDPIPATDTVGEAVRAGKLRCPRCNQYKSPEEYSTWTKKETGGVYRKRYCRPCRAEMERTKKFSKIETLEIYPRRLD